MLSSLKCTKICLGRHLMLLRISLVILLAQLWSKLYSRRYKLLRSLNIHWMSQVFNIGSLIWWTRTWTSPILEVCSGNCWCYSSITVLCQVLLTFTICSHKFSFSRRENVCQFVLCFVLFTTTLWTTNSVDQPLSLISIFPPRHWLFSVVMVVIIFPRFKSFAIWDYIFST